MRMRFLGCLGTGLACLLLLWQSEVSAGGKSDSKVKATATATKLGADGKQTVTITLDIEKGWHIYANPVGFKKFADNATDVTFKAKDKVVADVQYPVGKLKMDMDGKDTIEYRIYEGRVVLQAQLKRAPGDTSPLQISIDVNACDKTTCLFTGTVKLTVP